jgi:hypothetical protein
MSDESREPVVPLGIGDEGTMSTADSGAVGSACESQSHTESGQSESTAVRPTDDHLPVVSKALQPPAPPPPPSMMIPRVASLGRLGFK